MKVNNIFLDTLPKIDLHGYDRDTARVMTNDFIEDSYKLKLEKVLIIHGIGTGIVKEAVHNTLAKNKKVLSYTVDNQNIGCTIVYLNI